MSKQDFDDFINQATKNQNNESIIDWNTIRDEWLKRLTEFYALIESFLAEYKKDGKLDYQFSKKDIFEEYIGNYSVDVMDIKLGEHRVRLEPIGTNLIGAHGRVDLIGVNGKVKIGLVNKDFNGPKITTTVTVEGMSKPINQQPKEIKKTELAWKIVTPPPKIKYIDLNQDVFLDALLEVIGG